MCIVEHAFVGNIGVSLKMRLWATYENRKATYGNQREADKKTRKSAKINLKE